jgi:hypothetical protein
MLSLKRKKLPGLLLLCFSSAVYAKDSLPTLTQDLHHFHRDYKIAKQALLDQEAFYIRIAEALAEGDKALLQRTHKAIEEIARPIQKKLSQLDKRLADAELLCAPEELPEPLEAQCDALHVPQQRYEASHSTFTAMLEVLDNRYDEAKAVLR